LEIRKWKLEGWRLTFIGFQFRFSSFQFPTSLLAELLMAES